MVEAKAIRENAKVPPDGGYGWIVMGSYATTTMITVSIMGCFTLIFQEKFASMKMPVADMSLIFSMNSAFGSLLVGTFNGPLQSTFGYRKMGVAAGALFSMGIFLTSFADSFWQFFFFYGIITSLGTGISFPTFSLAIHSFFKTKRRKAIGIGLTIAGIGPIVFPQLIAKLLSVYSTQQTAMVLSAISLHIIAAALLLQPIAWHMKTAIPNQLEVANSEKSPSIEGNPESALVSAITKSEETITADGSRWELSSDEEDAYLDKPLTRYDSIDNDIDAQLIYGFEAVPQYRRHSTDYTTVVRQRKVIEKPAPSRQLLLRTFSVDTSNQSNIEPRWFESGSAATVNLESSLQIFSEKSDKPKDHKLSRQHSVDAGHLLPKIAENEVDDEPTIVLQATKYKWYESGSQDSVNLGSSVQIFNDRRSEYRRSLNTIPYNAHIIHERSMEILEKIHEQPEPIITTTNSCNNNHNGHDCLNEPIETKPPSFGIHCISDQIWKCLKSLRNRLSSFFNLSLLRDPVYINMMYAMSLAVCVEQNFSVLTPTILLNKGLSLSEQASVMSTIAISDVVSRFLSPLVGDKLKIKSSRTMFLISLGWLVFTRFILISTTTLWGLLVIGVMLGIGKGTRTVHMSVVIPDYIPIEKLPYAAGIQMIVNSMNLLLVVPIIGLLHDKQGKSFDAYLIAINFVTIFTICMWLVEFYFKKKSIVCFKPKIEPIDDTVYVETPLVINNK